MGFQTIIKEKEIKERLNEINIKVRELEDEKMQLRHSLKLEIEKNKTRRPSRFL